MVREKLCPRCGEDITDSHQQHDPDIGIMSGGWYCGGCDVFVDDEPDYDNADRDDKYGV